MRIPFSKEQILDRIQFENPWWETNRIEEYYAVMKKREYFKLLFPLIEETTIKRAVVLMGPRRVGKTVILFHTIQELINKGIEAKSICYLSVETPIYNGVALEELLMYFLEINGKTKSSTLYLFFDEIQYLKDWEVHLKVLVDSYHSIKFVVSGSAAAALRLKSVESGAGRFTDFVLPPLTFHEYLSLKNITELIESISSSKIINSVEYTTTDYTCNDIEALNSHFIDYINFGGYPEVSLSKVIQTDPGRYIRNDIIDKVLLRDLPLLYGIDNIQELNSLFTYIAYNSGGEMSLDSISRSSGVSKNTIKKYITYLEAAFLIIIVKRVDNNAKRFKRDNFFKVYLTNPSLRCALFTPIKEDDDITGNLVETAIFSQWQHAEFPLYYARWDNREVDIVSLNAKQKPDWAVEVKWSDRVVNDGSDLKNIASFCKSNNIKEATVTTYSVNGNTLINDISYHFIPSALYCFTVGKNIIEGKAYSYI